MTPIEEKEGRRATKALSGRVPNPTTATTATKTTTTTTTTVEIPKKLASKARYYIAPKVVLFSACQDDQKTAGIDNVRKLRLSFVPEGTKGGACTSLFLQVLYHHYKLTQQYERRGGIENGDIQNVLTPPGRMTYGKVLQHMQDVCQRNHYTQRPHLSSSRPLVLHEDHFQIVPDNFGQTPRKGTKRALIIGINYTNTPYALLDCHNDCRNVIAFLKQVHEFDDANIMLLLDDPIICDKEHQPTKVNILKAFGKFAMECQEGDVLFLHYAGHGVAVEDKSGDEPDGYDEALMPADYMTAGEIIDDDIFRVLLIPMPKNVIVTALFDCCHSGTILDLPFEYTIDNPVCDYGGVTFPHMHMVKAFKQQVANIRNDQDFRITKSEEDSIRLSPLRRSRRGGRTKQTYEKVNRRASKSLDPSICRLAQLPEDFSQECEAKSNRSVKQAKSRTEIKNNNVLSKLAHPPTSSSMWKKIIPNTVGCIPASPSKRTQTNTPINKKAFVEAKAKAPIVVPLTTTKATQRQVINSPENVSCHESPKSKTAKKRKDGSPRKRSQSQPPSMVKHDTRTKESDQQSLSQKYKSGLKSAANTATRVISPKRSTKASKSKNAYKEGAKESRHVTSNLERHRNSRTLTPKRGRTPVGPSCVKRKEQQRVKCPTSPTTTRTPRKGRHARVSGPGQSMTPPPSTIQVPSLVD